MKKTLAILLTGLSLAGVGMAQTQTPDTPTFREAVEVRVMDLDVVVTDSRGKPVVDLSREDFTVRVDGRSVPIDYFARIDEGTIHAPDLATASPERLLAEYRKGGEAYVPRHFLIYVDSGHLSPGYRNRSLEALRDFVTRLGPSDSARVVLFDRRPKELTEWTTSKEALLSALSKIESAGVGMSRLLTEQQALREIDSSFSTRSRAFAARNYAEQERAEVQSLLDSVSGELSTLAPLAGKKAFLFVSGGFETQPGYAMTAYATGLGLSAFDVRNVGQELDQIVRRANASDVTFYTVDARGLQTEGGSADNDSPLAGRSSVSFLARQDSQSGLQTLARETGGVALVNSNDLQRGLSRIYEDASTYYSIGVNLSKLPASGYQQVRVDVKRPGLTVRARRGYAARSPEDRARENARAALLTNVAHRAFPVSLRPGPVTKQKKHYAQPISVTVPASALTFLAQGDTSRAAAEYYIGAIDDKGNTSEITRNEASFDLPKDAPPDAPITYSTTLQMRKGNHRVVVNVRDKETGRTGTAKADLRVE